MPDRFCFHNLSNLLSNNSRKSIFEIFKNDTNKQNSTQVLFFLGQAFTKCLSYPSSHKQVQESGTISCSVSKCCGFTMLGLMGRKFNTPSMVNQQIGKECVTELSDHQFNFVTGSQLFTPGTVLQNAFVTTEIILKRILSLNKKVVFLIGQIRPLFGYFCSFHKTI